MAIIKAYTDIPQSKKLAKILPLESADMFWLVVGNIPRVHVLTEPLSNYSYWENYPCWSLASLLGVLPEKYTELIKEGGMYRVIIKDSYITSLFDNPVDACVSMIEELNELKKL